MAERKILAVTLEDESRYTVGHNGVEKIEEHSPLGEGDRWSWLVYIDNGELIRHFDVVSVRYDKLEPEKSWEDLPF
jgi:gluconate kinase